MAENFEREKELFNEALQLSSSEARRVFLKEACGPAHDLREKIETLLRAFESADRFIPTKGDGASGPHVGVVLEQPGDRIGRFKLLQKIGEGGMGVVYLSEQEEPVRRRVALKIIKLGMDTKAVVARFEAERQALALMDHANIARVLDGGATEAGRPYFVMELVRGVKITDYCSEAKLCTRDRLELFIKVCQAIQHAHQKGVIHRDIKPSNILVTINDGVAVPKVIDFGIAKATEERLTSKTLFTRFEAFMGTPAYMSPEQAVMTSLDIDTRSDIYSLGVLLYELLAGTTPFEASELAASGIDAMRRTLMEKEPVRPSTKLSQELTAAAASREKGTDLSDKSSAALTRRRCTHLKEAISIIRGDLDWIVMKCLEKDRSRRYETANDLANDIQRHLSNEAVLARPPSAAYRFRKLVRRNKLPFVAAGVVALTLMVGLSFSTWAFLRERKAHAGEAEQRGKADAEKVTAERHLFVANMNLAQQAWEQNQIGRLRQVLEETQSFPNRAFEWYYWQRQAHLPSRTLQGHLEDVTSVAFSPDSRQIITGSWDWTAKIWEAASGRELLRLKGHRAPIWCVAFSPDGRTIVTGSWDQTATVWDAANGTSVVTLEGHIAPIRSVAFSADSRRIVTGSWDQTAKVWDASNGMNLATLAATNGIVGSVAFSADGQRIVTGLGDNTAKVWDTISGRELLTLKGHEHQVRSVAFSSDGQHIVTSSDDQTAKVWDAVSGKLELTLKGHGAEIYSVAFSPDSKRIVTGGADNTARVWDAVGGGQLLTLKGHSAGIWSVAFSPNGRWLVTGSWDQTAKLWDVVTGDSLLPLRGHGDRVTAMTLSPDAKLIVTGSEDKSAKIWESASGRELLSLQGHTAGIGAVAFSRDGQFVVTGGGDQTAKVWETSSGRQRLTLQGHIGGVRTVAFSVDGLRLVTGGDDRTARVWDTASGRQLVIFNGHSGGISSAAFSPDGQRIVTVSAKQAKVWEASSGRELFSLEGHSARIMSVAFSPDGRRIVTGSWDQTAKVWETASGRDLLTLNGHSGGISSVTFSPDGHRILTGSDDNTARLWEEISGRELLSLTGHNAGIWAVAFSPDGQRVVTGSRDQMVKVWETANEVQVATWQKEDRTAAERLAILRRNRREAQERQGLHHAGDAGAMRRVSFSKWTTLLPADPPSLAGSPLAGVVGGDVGTGRLAGEILGDSYSVPGFWLGHARYEFYGERYSFIADVRIAENNTTEPASAVVNGFVTQGWRKGAQVTGQYLVVSACSVPTPGNVSGTMCSEGTLQIEGGSEQ